MSWKCKDAYWGPRWQKNGGNDGNGRNGNGGNGNGRNGNGGNGNGGNGNGRNGNGENGNGRNGNGENGNGRNGNGGNRNGGNGKNGAEESLDLSQVAQTLQEVAKQLGGLAKALASSAFQEEDLRQKVIFKLHELNRNVCAGAGSDLDLACLLRCLNCLGAGSD